ncbi:MAG: hypothetical protein R2727_02550 [Bacteroidales bacterium]
MKRPAIIISRPLYRSGRFNLPMAKGVIHIPWFAGKAYTVETLIKPVVTLTILKRIGKNPKWS